MIVKIQRPLMTNGDEPMALIYSKDRYVEYMCPFHQVEELFGMDEQKIYHHAVLGKGRKLLINKRAPDQDW
jgi:hypothetical protein